jgi:hypothetical protein
MKSYELPIDLEALKTNARPLPGITDTQRNWSAVREQMHYDRSAAPPDERDRRRSA